MLLQPAALAVHAGLSSQPSRFSAVYSYCCSSHSDSIDGIHAAVARNTILPVLADTAPAGDLYLCEAARLSTATRLGLSLAFAFAFLWSQKMLDFSLRALPAQPTPSWRWSTRRRSSSRGEPVASAWVRRTADAVRLCSRLPRWALCQSSRAGRVVLGILPTRVKADHQIAVRRSAASPRR